MSRRRLLRLTSVAAAGLIGYGLLGLGIVTSPASAGMSPHLTPADSSAYDWAEFHQSPQLTGYAANSPLSAANASQLGVAWDTNLYGPALDSPVVAYDPTLGESLAYVGTEHGDVLAIALDTGQIVWSDWLGSPIRSTPVVADGAVFAGTFNSPRLYKMDASTGNVDCSVVSPQPIEGTPLAVTPVGGVPTVYIGTNDSATSSGPLLAVNQANCSLEWSFTSYATIAGTWDAASYGVDAAGEPLIVFGTADPDSAVYALDAVTGAEVWRFASYNPPPGAYDVGAGVTISPPGANGFADGVAYVPSKFGIMYALDLTTGTQIWSFNFNQYAGTTEGGRSTAALDGTNLVFGYAEGMFDLNAVTGALIWQYEDPSATEALSSPAIAGSPGDEVVAVGDIGGGVEVVSLATGAQLYHYQTGGYITASPAISDGNILIASSDGFLYDFAVGGGNESPLPSTEVTSPAPASTVPNPNGDLTITGRASDTTGLDTVEVAIQASGPDGPWWDGATASWSPGPVANEATLAAPGAPTSDWSLGYPEPGAGGTYQVTANAVSTTGQADITGGQTSYVVLSSTKGAHIKANPSFVSPGASVTVTGSGFGDSEPITIALLGTALVTTTSTPKGDIAATKVKIPASSAFGQTSLTATGGTSGKSAAAALTIANTWEQLDYGPSHTDFEPNDSTLFYLVHPGGNIFTDLAWHYQSGSPVDTSPAIADGVAYVANKAGQLMAIDIHNGAPLWTWSLRSGNAIAGSPAVDPSKGLVFVGANDGTLDAVSTSTGATAWSTEIGGDVSAPMYSNGQIYVTSSTGTVEAVSESTGTESWAMTLASPVTASPALDATDGALIVGESNGDVVSIPTSGGTPTWTFATGGAIAASADVTGGVVYVGSADKRIYALHASTGDLEWSYKTDGLVKDTPAVTDAGTPSGITEVLVGSNDGSLYALAASSGALEYKLPFRSPIVGLATVRGVTVVTTARGIVGSARDYTDLDVWNYQTGAAISAAPVVVDGAIYVGAGDGNLYAFTSYGQPPI
ncbi:MAG: PQQ-binding-like beta-propeller repeat protein [Acidimicrobiales bacterium]